MVFFLPFGRNLTLELTDTSRDSPEALDLAATDRLARPGNGGFSTRHYTYYILLEMFCQVWMTGFDDVKIRED